jgi:hypothetical protein
MSQEDARVFIHQVGMEKSFANVLVGYGRVLSLVALLGMKSAEG